MADNAICKALNIILANENVLLVHTRAAHWNVEDPAFGLFHQLFGDQYSVLSSLVDQIAERCRQLEGVALGSMEEFLAQSTIKGLAGKTQTGKAFATKLLDMQNHVISLFMVALPKVDSQDRVTGNLIQDWIAVHQKMTWFLRSHLK